MFFSDKLLCRSGKFSIIWIAGTRGTKYLNKSQIQGVNIAGTCEDVMIMVQNQSSIPKQKLSLFLSAKLMYGLVLIYSKKTNNLMKEICLFLNIVRKPSVFTESESVEEGSIPKTRPITPRKKKITPELEGPVLTVTEPEEPVHGQRVEDITLAEISNVPRPQQPPEDLGDGSQLLEEILGAEGISRTVTEQIAVPNLRENGNTDYIEIIPKLRKLKLGQDISGARDEIPLPVVQQKDSKSIPMDVIEEIPPPLPQEGELMPPPTPQKAVRPPKKIKRNEEKKYYIHIVKNKFSAIDLPNSELDYYRDNPILQLFDDVHPYKQLKGINDVFECFLSPDLRIRHHEESVGQLSRDQSILRKTGSFMMTPPSTSKMPPRAQSTLLQTSNLGLMPAEQIAPEGEQQIEVLPSVQIPTMAIPEGIIAEVIELPRIIEENGTSDAVIPEDERWKETLKQIYALKDNEKITVEDITKKPHTRKNIARSYMNILNLAKERYVELIMESDEITLSHIKIGPKLMLF